MNNRVKGYYDVIAGEYAKDCFDELDRKPFDRSILQRYSELVRGKGRVCDMGCGPGEIARYIKDLGIDVFGVDLSEGMIEEANRLCPDIEFEQGNMLDLRFGDNSLAGIIAFYAIVNLTKDEVKSAIKEFYRVVNQNGHLLVSFHIGDNQSLTVEKQVEGNKVDVDFVFFNPDDVIKIIENAGFEIEEAVIRYPYKEVEYQSKRAYILARKNINPKIS